MTASRLASPVCSSIVLYAAIHAGAAAAPEAASAPDRTFEGVFVTGSGLDHNRVTVRRAGGRRIQAWCVALCDAGFEPVSDHDEQRLRPAHAGKRVTVSLRTEPNNGRITGPDEQKPLLFLKAIRFVRTSSARMSLRD